MSKESKEEQKELQSWFSTKTQKKNTNKKVKEVKKLFEMITKNPKQFISRKELSIDKFRAISDFISGMTDRYAINLYKDLK